MSVYNKPVYDDDDDDDGPSNNEVSLVACRCGEIGHVAVQCSKASEVNCYNCGKTGHLARECTIEASA